MPTPFGTWWPRHRPEPVKSFRYGAILPGMQPDAATAQPEPLDPDTTYSLVVESGGLKGELTFQPPP